MATGIASRVRGLARGLALVMLACAILTAIPATAGVTLKEYRAILKDNKKKPLTRFQLLAQHIGGGKRRPEYKCGCRQGGLHQPPSLCAK